MNRTDPTVFRTAFFAAQALLCISFCLSAQAQTSAQPPDELTVRYQQDLAECEAQQATQDLVACRLEARNALAEAKRNLLSDTTANLFEKTNSNAAACSRVKIARPAKPACATKAAARAACKVAASCAKWCGPSCLALRAKRYGNHTASVLQI